MDGIILFADDHVFTGQTFENKIFQSLKTKGIPVLPIDGLDDFEKTIKSISTFKAIILDWEFVEVLEEIENKKNPLDILLSKDLFSLIFIYSNTTIEEETQQKLNLKFNGKIFFLNKISDDEQIEAEITKILTAITEYETGHPHLSTPFKWSNAINKSVQTIFNELELADKYWVKDLYYSSYFKKKGIPQEPPPVDPNVQVINLFQNLLSEKLIQDVELRDSIGKYSKDHMGDEVKEEDLKKLYQRLYYTKTLETDTIMTGDVFEFDEDKFGIIISPECDMNTLISKGSPIEILCFAKDSFKTIKQILNIKSKDAEPEILSRAYNQENPRIHLLPVFPNNGTSSTMLIDFRFDLKYCKGSYLQTHKATRKIKINSPYIQQLRQRHLAYLGRVGVPSVPDILRTGLTP